MVPTLSKEALRQQVLDRFWETVPSIWNQVRNNLRCIAAESFEISVEQFHILRHVRRGICSVSELATAKNISRPAVSQAVDLLVNNAFSFVAKGADAERSDWERTFQVGPIAYATMAARCAGPMKAAGGGAVVNVSSISARIAQPGRWTYNSAKGAVANLTRCMALDLAPSGIRVNSVSPGWIWTREVAKAAQGDRDKWEPLWGDFHILRRLGEPVEVAAAILFLLSEDSAFITGADLPVDGGYQALGSEGLGTASQFAGSH